MLTGRTKAAWIKDLTHLFNEINGFMHRPTADLDALVYDEAGGLIDREPTIVLAVAMRRAVLAELESQRHVKKTRASAGKVGTPVMEVTIPARFPRPKGCN